MNRVKIIEDNGTRNRRLLIWSLLNVEELCKRYL